MIWPWSFSWRGLTSVQVTLALLLLNFFLFVVVRDIPSEKLIEKSLTSDQIILTGKLYAQFKGQSVPEESPEILKNLRTALEDQRFIHLAPQMQFRGDQVQIRAWKKAWTGYHDYLARRTLNTFGLSSDRSNWANAVSYQFMHADGFHLMSNMSLLVLFGFAIELSLGGLWVLGIYLFGGILGGFAYLSLSGFSIAPMVGASISVSALIGFYMLIERKKSIRFMYFFSPLPGYFGEIWMSKWAIVPLFMVSDLMMILRHNAEFTPVAHIGHLAGLVFGLLAGGAVSLLVTWLPQWEQSLFASYSQSRSEAPEN